MRELGMVLTLAFGVAGGLRAQASSPQVDVTGRAITLLMVRGPQQVRGELLAVRRDSVWVLTGRPGRVVAVRLGDCPTTFCGENGVIELSLIHI